MPHAAVATFVVSPSPTPSDCFAKIAAIIGCGRSKTSKWLTSWRYKIRGQTVANQETKCSFKRILIIKGKNYLVEN